MTSRIAALIEAYHVVFDIKDDATDRGQIDGVFSQCFDVARGIAELIERLGGTPPRRFDGDGRPEPEAPWFEDPHLWHPITNVLANNLQDAKYPAREAVAIGRALHEAGYAIVPIDNTNANP